MTNEISRMKAFQKMFQNSSQAFLDENQRNLASRGAIIHPDKKNAILGILASAKPYPKKMIMNKTESAFAQRLEIMKLNGEILRYEYQGMTLRWGVDSKTGDSMRYTPDFVVFSEHAVGYANPIRLIETKGSHIHYRQQAIARFKGCRSDWPEFQFEMHQQQKGGAWKRIL